MNTIGPAANPSRLYPLTDPLGNARFITDSTGTLRARYNYDPYGNVRTQEGAAVSAFTFAGEQTDGETGLTFLRARYYDPTTGVFLSRDPVLGPLNLSLEHGEYLYARNNPVNLTDPSGELIDTVWDACMLVYDLYSRDWESLGIDALLTLVPGMPGGAGLVRNTGYSVTRPVVSSSRLKNIVNSLYKGLKSPNPIGTGSTADAIRHTIQTGELVGGKDHIIKGQQSINALNNFLRKRPKTPRLC